MGVRGWGQGWGVRGRRSPGLSGMPPPAAVPTPSGAAPSSRPPPPGVAVAPALHGLPAPAVYSQPPPPPPLLIFIYFEMLEKSEKQREDYSSSHVCTRKEYLLSVELAVMRLWLFNQTFFHSPLKYAYDHPDIAPVASGLSRSTCRGSSGPPRPAASTSGPAGACPQGALPHPLLDGRGISVGRPPVCLRW